jgi:hypothetical protein
VSELKPSAKMGERNILLTLVALGAIFGYWQYVSRRKKDYRELIEPMLQHAGYRFLSAKAPRLFDVGPFPKFEVKSQPVQTITPIGRGEYDQYRIVYAAASDGKEKSFWVRLEFAAFRFSKAEWRPSLE